jgi:hypothetical protein
VVLSSDAHCAEPRVHFCYRRLGIRTKWESSCRPAQEGVQVNVSTSETLRQTPNMDARVTSITDLGSMAKS